jgi:hypothetical protein
MHSSIWSWKKSSLTMRARICQASTVPFVLNGCSNKNLLDDIDILCWLSLIRFLLIFGMEILGWSNWFADETLVMVWSFIIKVAPCPIPLLSTYTVPPIYSIKCLQILSPRPVPYLFYLLWSANLLKLINSLLRSSLAMPGPESVIEI